MSRSEISDILKSTTSEKRAFLKRVGFDVKGDKRSGAVIDNAIKDYLSDNIFYRSLSPSNVSFMNEIRDSYNKRIAAKKSEVELVLENSYVDKLNSLRFTGEEVNIDFESSEDFAVFLRLMRSRYVSYKYLITFPDGTIRTLSLLGIDAMLESINTEFTDSFYQSIIEDIDHGTTVTISKHEYKNEGYMRKSGGFVKYIHHTEYDFSRYQLYSEFDKNNYDHNCLYVALQHCGVDQVGLNQLQTYVKNRNVAKACLTDIANELDINIKVYEYKKNSSSTDPTSYGDSSKKECRIGFYDNHYFVRDEFEKGSVVIGGKNIRSSLSLFKNLFDDSNSHLVSLIDNYKLNEIGYNDDKIENLEFNSKKMEDYNKTYQDSIKKMGAITFDPQMEQKWASEVAAYKLKKSEEEAATKVAGYVKPALAEREDLPVRHLPNGIQAVYYADYECTTNETFHIPYQIGVMSSTESDISEKNFVCFNYVDEKSNLTVDLLNYICSRHSPSLMRKEKGKKNNGDGKFEESILIYFHNAKYDTCLLDFNKIANLDICSQDGNFYNMRFVYTYCGKMYNFQIRDSHKHLTEPLKKLPKLFKLDEDSRYESLSRKEIIPYNYYTMKNIEKGLCSIEGAIDCLKKHHNNCTEADIEQFRKNLVDWKVIHGDNFDIVEYSRRYNHLDVVILKTCMEMWRSQAYVVAGLDIYEVLTSASFAQKFFEKGGGYNKIKKINQIPRKFIQKSVYGGRCMSNKNAKQFVRAIIDDFDAVSLYPSAMLRLIELGGFLMGYPKIISYKNLSYEFLQEQDGYFVEILVKSFGKTRSFPLIPAHVKDCLVYDEEKLIGTKIIVGRIQLEDLIEFQDIKFEIIRGYYYDQGRDPRICELIKILFAMRLYYKGIDSLIQAIIKLIMNSSYGKTIQKECDTRSYIVVDGPTSDGKILNEKNWFIEKHYDNIKTINQIGRSNKYMIHVYSDVNNHFCMPHVGSEILAMSKRIMSEVMCLAEDNGLKIYYQDTDSMHIKSDDVPKLQAAFKEKYGRDLIGEGMGQFHSDFNSDKLGKKNKLYSILFICVGKKAYIDVLSDGNGGIDFHYRMKGVSKASIDHYCSENKISVVDLYKKLYNGEKIKFDLVCDNKVPKFNIECFTVKSVLQFNRDIWFHDDKVNLKKIEKFEQRLLKKTLNKKL